MMEEIVPSRNTLRDDGNKVRPGILVKILLRDKEYEVRPGMTLRDALQKIGVQSEGVLASRQGQLITDDEILAEGDVIKLITVISGG